MNGPACAHSRVTRGTVPTGFGDGSVYDEWRCADCRQPFTLGSGVLIDGNELAGLRMRLASLDEEVDRLRRREAGLLDQNQAIAANVVRMMPVVEAAKAWRPLHEIGRAGTVAPKLAAAVDEYEKGAT